MIRPFALVHTANNEHRYSICLLASQSSVFQRGLASVFDGATECSAALISPKNAPAVIFFGTRESSGFDFVAVRSFLLSVPKMYLSSSSWKSDSCVKER
eukprot:m.863081 g.863081  ORF g.863081 m.863081 type:complete len:99 (+) comp59695_c0_seq9:3-299(+)